MYFLPAVRAGKKHPVKSSQSCPIKKTMPRQPRLDAPGVLQHVMARGIERRKIFWDDKDRSSFLERLAMIFEETQTQCYAWALIPNHFHLLLRTSLSASADASRCRAGPTSLSTVMRRLMTGYAVTFNIRHRRSGHLFQNRYKSVVCEEDPYLLELIRYIHLNPLRAGLVEDLNALDKYPWTGHSTILGRCKNPLIPETQASESFSADKRIVFSQFRPRPPRVAKHCGQAGIEKVKNNPEDSVDRACPVAQADGTGVKNKPLAEKTVEDVLRYFGDNLGVARTNYRRFVEKGIKQGRRSELQGGGLIRSSGGDTSVLSSNRKEDRELSDQRILGSGDFVAFVIQDKNELEEKRLEKKIPLDKLIRLVSDFLRIEKSKIFSRSRKRIIGKARALIAYYAIYEMGYKGAEVGRALRIAGSSVSQCIERGKNLVDTEPEMYQKLTMSPRGIF